MIIFEYHWEIYKPFIEGLTQKTFSIKTTN